MEINPQTVQLQKPLTQHIIKIELQWTPENILGGIINYDESGNNPCIVTGGSGGQYGSATYQIIDKVGGHYNIQFSFNIPCEYPRIVLSAQYSIYYDQEFIRSGEFTLGDCYSGSSYPHHNTTYRSPLITDYSFPIYNPNLCYGSGIPIQLEYGHGCTDIEIDTSRAAGDVINLQILTGSEFVSFYDQQGNATDNITVLNSELERVELKQDVLYSGIPTDVLVQSTISGLSKDNTFKIYPKSEYKIDVSYVSYPIKSNEIKYMEVISLGPGGCYVKLPEEIKLEAKIIKGNALGHLEDFDNGVSGDSLNNIVFNDFGGNHIGFVGEGVNENNIDTVIVRFSTTDIELNIIDVPIIITPGSLVVEIEPDTLLPGQSAIIRIKERLDDGRIVDFSDQQTFEIGILDGCILGKLNAEGIDTNYFYGVTKPIFFTADTNAISGTVKLRVGAIYEVTPGRPEKVETEFRSKGSEKQNSTTSQFCYIGEYLTSDYTYANVVVGNDECEKDRPNGLSFIDESMFEITQLSNNSNCDVQLAENHLQGGSSNYSKTGYGFDWKNARAALNVLTFSFEWSICMDILKSNFTKAVFVDFDPVANTFSNIKTVGQARDAINEFKKIGIDGEIPKDIKYYPIQKTSAHEMEHINQYKKAIIPEFIRAFSIIVHRQPPYNFCKLSPDEYEKMLTQEEEFYYSVIREAENNVRKYIDSNSEINESWAQAEGFYYVRNTIIPALKSKFEIK